MALVAVLLAVAKPASADVLYDVVGDDLYRIESGATLSHISYSGTERLTIKQHGKEFRFTAQARYTRYSARGKASAEAFFVQVLSASGGVEDRVDDDPDFLTILNQPFAIRLDRATLRDVRELRGGVPFAAPSPLGGETVLRGFLRPGRDGLISGRPTVAVRFQAAGPMSGALDGKADQVSGSMRMDGTAYYALDDAILRALVVTLTINARLHEEPPASSMPLRILYRRSIRAARKASDP